MQITEVHLRNWRSYRNATFEFSTVKKSHRGNVILIGAQNGVGKTSLLIALYLGLFGREAMHLIEGIRLSGTDGLVSASYKTLIESILHRPASKKEVEPYAMVRLKFVDSFGQKITIRRMWNFTNSGKVRSLDSTDGEEVLIEVNGEPAQSPSWQEANHQIAELLFPQNVMPCFFFDGEQAQARVDAAGRTSLLSAVKTLYGTKLLDELRQSLHSYYEKEKTELRKQIGQVKSDDLSKKKDELSQKRAELDEATSILEIKKEERERVSSQINKLTEEIAQLFGDNQTDTEQYSQTLNALDKEKSDLQRNLHSGLVSISLPLALSRKGPALINTLQAEITRDKWINIRDTAQNKAEKIVKEVLPDGGPVELSPALTVKQEEFLRRKLKQALEALWSPPPQGCAEFYNFPFLGEGDRIALVQKIQHIMSTAFPDIEDTVFELSRVEAKRRETARRYELVKDVAPRVTAIKEALSQGNGRLIQITEEISALTINRDNLLNGINDLKGAIGQMEKRQSQADPVQRKLSVIQNVMEVLNDATEKLVPLCKLSLEERCSYHFSKMISDEFKNCNVIFSEDSGPNLVLNSETISVSSLSGAQKRAFGLAFTLAIADVSQQQAPIIIDTPVGNMDSEYRSRVLEHVSRAANGQVIILSHDEEISEPYKKQLEPQILQTMLMQFRNLGEGAGETSIIPDKYFGEVI